MSDYQLGLVSISFRKHTPEEIIQAVKAAGLSCIEWGSDVHAPCKDTDRLQSIAALQKEYGIECSSYGTYFNLETHSLDDLPDYIAAAGILGTNVLRLWGGTRKGADMTEEELATFTDTCRRAAAMAEEAGVILCLVLIIFIHHSRNICHIIKFFNINFRIIKIMKCFPVFQSSLSVSIWIIKRIFGPFAQVIIPIISIVFHALQIICHFPIRTTFIIINFFSKPLKCT